MKFTAALALFASASAMRIDDFKSLAQQSTDTNLHEDMSKVLLKLGDLSGQWVDDGKTDVYEFLETLLKDLKAVGSEVGDVSEENGGSLTAQIANLQGAVESGLSGT